jgi:hypothetical protein
MTEAASRGHVALGRGVHRHEHGQQSARQIERQVLEAVILPEAGLVVAMPERVVDDPVLGQRDVERRIVLVEDVVSLPKGPII